jgi:hypothetical protein
MPETYARFADNFGRIGRDAFEFSGTEHGDEFRGGRKQRPSERILDSILSNRFEQQPADGHK